MIYAYDQEALMPTKELYDTLLMAMAINAAKDMYDKGEQAIKDFRKEYGDFSTALTKDAEWYKDNFNYQQMINDLYSRGIDPLRSQEGRAAVNRWINTRDYTGLADRKLSAENYNEYLDNRAKLIAAGKFNEDIENYFLGDMNPDTWDSSKGNIWTRKSPMQAFSIKDLTENYLDKRTPGELNANQVGEFGMEYDPNAKYIGYAPSQLKEDIAKAVPGMIGNPMYEYFRDYARRQLEANGIEATEDAINDRFLNMAAEANREYLVRPTADLNDHYKKLEFALKQRELALKQEQLNAKKAAARSSSGSKNNRAGTDKEYFSDALFLLERGVANILKNTYLGRAADVYSYADFDPEKLDGLLYGAQQEVADKYYTSAISGGGETITEFEPRSAFRLNLNNPLEDSVNRMHVRQTEFKEINGDKKAYERLSQANRSFLDNYTLDYSPAKFAKWVNKSTVSGDDSMINISNDEEAISKIYSIDEIALSSAGVNRPSSDLKWAKDITDGSRKVLLKSSNIKNLYMKSTGKFISRLGLDGAVHTYQLVNIYNAGKKSYEKNKNVGIVAYDMGITTYDNPNFGISSLSNNLYLDEGRDDLFTGDQSVLHWEHVNPNKIYSNPAYPSLFDEEYENNDEDDDN